MNTMQALNKIQHRTVRIDRAQACAACADQRMMPVVLSEFRKLCISYPILFTKNRHTGAFTCVALMGFEEGENLFWRDGALDAVYTPLNIRRQPFFVGKNGDSNGQERRAGEPDFLVCINMESAGLASDGGEALFDTDGKGTAFLSEMQSVLAQLTDGEAPTAGFIETILHLTLMTPISLDITFDNQQKLRVEGMYSIDEDKLGALSGAQLAGLRDAGYLEALYLMIASVGQIYPLIQRKNARLAAPSKWFQSAD